MNCAVLTGNSAGLRTVLSSRLSLGELCSSLRESHTHIQFSFSCNFFTQLNLECLGPFKREEMEGGENFIMRCFLFCTVDKISGSTYRSIPHPSVIMSQFCTMECFMHAGMYVYM